MLELTTLQCTALQYAIPTVKLKSYFQRSTKLVTQYVMTQPVCLYSQSGHVIYTTP